MRIRRDIFVLAVGALLGGLVLLSAERSGVYTVTLTEGGFVPSLITIQTGDTVRFVSTAGKYFWPASDPHPVHSYYSAFDPRRPIAPQESWSYRFDTPGTWKFHDHLAAYYTGEVTVLAPGASQVRSACAANPSAMPCWLERLEAAYAKDGLDAAFDEMSTLYRTDPAFAKNCHGAVHNLGLKGYEAYLKDHSALLNPKAAICGNGFYHGFMEALLGTTGDIAEAKKACDSIPTAGSGASPDAHFQCYHGIGHGVMETVVVNRASYGTLEGMAEEGLKLCREAARGGEEMYRCASGIFNAAANWYIAGTFGVSLADDFLALCARTAREHKLSCYGNMNAAVMKKHEDHFLPAAGEILAIPDREYRTEALGYLAAIYAVQKLDPKHHGEGIEECHALPSGFQETCLNGFANGLMEHGPPGEEYLLALGFCRHPGLSLVEASACERNIAAFLPERYSGGALTAACAQVDAAYQKFCHY